MLILRPFYVLFQCVSCAGFISNGIGYIGPINKHIFSKPKTSGQDEIRPEQQIRIMYYFQRVGKPGIGHELNKSDFINFEERDSIVLTCCILNKSEPNLKLRWEVDQYKIKTKINPTFENISLVLTPDRDFDGMNVSCVATSETDKNAMTQKITLRLTRKPTTIPTITGEIRKNEGDSLSAPEEHCIVMDKASNKLKFGNQSNTLIDNLRMEHNGSRMVCANLKHTGLKPIIPNLFTRKFDNFEMSVSKWRVIVSTEANQTIGNDANKKLDGTWRKKTEHEVGRDERRASLSGGPNSKNYGKELKIFAVGICVLLIVLIIILTFYKRRGKHVELKLIEHIYAEPHYVDIQTPVPPRNQTPYATIIGLLTHKKIPDLPPRNRSDISDDSSASVSVRYHAHDETIHIQADSVQINNHYTIMQ